MIIKRNNIEMHIRLLGQGRILLEFSTGGGGVEAVAEISKASRRPRQFWQAGRGISQQTF